MNFIDLHCDTLARLYGSEMPEASKGTAAFKDSDSLALETLWQNTGHLDLSRLLKSDYFAQFFACFINTGNPPIGNSHFEDALAMISMLKEALVRHPEFALALSGQDYRNIRSQGKIACLLTIEEGGILNQDLSRLELLYRQGIRLITLTWNYENCIGFPHKMSSFSNTGLKPFGMEVIKEMNRLGILIDVSHLSDAGFDDVYQHSQKPFVASHSCARALCGHSRNLTDEMIRRIGNRQGLIGVNFYGAFLQPDGESTIDMILHHIRHIITIGGLDVIALGSDFDGMDCPLEISGCQDMQKLLPAFEKNGFTPKEMDAICYKNAERILLSL